MTAVAVHEPTVFEVADEDTAERLRATLERVAAAADDGRPDDAVRIFCELVANGDELATLSDSGYLEEAQRYLPNLLREAEQSGRTEARPDGAVGARQYHRPGPAAARLGVRPGRVVHRRHRPPGRASRRSPGAGVIGGGHFGVALKPEAVAAELVGFLEAARRPA